MEMEKNERALLVAPCGMDCAICGAYLAGKHDVKSKGVRMPYCKGCRPRGKMCAFLKKRCPTLMQGGVEFCFECGSFPCGRLRTIDKRYRERYRTSLIGNSKLLRKIGMGAFLRKQEKEWRCAKCGGTICCHNGLCFACDIYELRKRKQKYRWRE
ncbi:MAG: DUF3795 domain-containing protein [Euryarchaeota archaeon]|nr:DUF3795 domain-containing protein [Euryarchaeota archaeon]